MASDVVASLNTQKIRSKRYKLNGPCFENLIEKVLHAEESFGMLYLPP